MSFARQVELVDLSRARPLSCSPPRKPHPYLNHYSTPSARASPSTPRSEPAEHPPHAQLNDQAATPLVPCALSSSSHSAPRPDIVSAQITHALTGKSFPPHSVSNSYLHHHVNQHANVASVTATPPPANISHPLSHSPFFSSNSSSSATSSSLSSSYSTASTAASSYLIHSETREELFRNCLAQSTVDVDHLRRLVWTHGIPSALWARPLVWKLLTTYLPPDRADWDSQLAAKRARYWTTVHDLTIDPSARPVDGDHPLNDDDSSQWRQYFHDSQLRTTIQRDVRRTHPNLPRFARLRDALEQMLFVFAKLHRHVGYRQGMNELAAPFLLVFDDDNSSTGSVGTNPITHGGIGMVCGTGSGGGGGGVGYADISNVEADAYFCFESIMNEMTPLFAPAEHLYQQQQQHREKKQQKNETTAAEATTELSKKKGDAASGLSRQLRELQALLRIKDPDLDRHLERLGVDTRFYGLRWIRVWLSREFELRECLGLWDSFLTAEERLPWVRCVCVAMAIRIRNRLLRADFAGCMKLLLNYPPCDVMELLRIAERLRTSNVVIVRTARP